MNNAALIAPGTVGASRAPGESTSTLRLQCPVCSHSLRMSELRDCPHEAWSKCGFMLSEVDGIFRSLPPDRKSYFSQFIREYELVRAKEGRGSSSPDYYLELPFKDLTDRNSWQWRIRARTWRHMTKHILPEIENSYPQGCDVLDIGAGNGWLSYRMSLRGHRLVAVDLLENDSDGLGAARHYLARMSRPFLRFQAEMDRLPFAAEQFDVAIFNASFHYSVDYEQTLAEALRCVRSPGHVIIADSPFYSSDDSGKKMLVEKRAEFERRFGMRADSVQTREYLTPEVLNQLAAKLGLRWSILKPWYGINWAVRPAKARLLRRREPSKFYLLWTKVHNS
jgi:SAM-dependent methyltransferase